MKIPRIRRDVYRSGKRQCHWCHKPLSLIGDRGAIMTIEHVIPKSKGGKNKRGNYVPACLPCNQRRGNMDYDAFANIAESFLDRCLR